LREDHPLIEKMVSLVSSSGGAVMSSLPVGGPRVEVVVREAEKRKELRAVVGRAIRDDNEEEKKELREKKTKEEQENKKKKMEEKEEEEELEEHEAEERGLDNDDTIDTLDEEEERELEFSPDFEQKLRDRQFIFHSLPSSLFTVPHRYAPGFTPPSPPLLLLAFAVPFPSSAFFGSPPSASPSLSPSPSFSLPISSASSPSFCPPPPPPLPFPSSASSSPSSFVTVSLPFTPLSFPYSLTQTSLLIRPLLRRLAFRYVEKILFLYLSSTTGPLETSLFTAMGYGQLGVLKRLAGHSGPRGTVSGERATLLH
jgi:hypothetical protein